MKLVDILSAVLLIALGVLHCVGTAFNASAAGMVATLWSFSAGMFMVLVGALNLLRIRYAAIAFGVRAVSAAANVALLGLAVALAGAFGMKHHLHSMGVVAVVLLATLLSFWPRNENAHAAAER